jgi:ubiquinone/menaquinone biosynthesis C-methylase UbiE
MSEERKIYWSNRYKEQGIRAVGRSSFTPVQFEESSFRAIKRLLAFLDENKVVASKFLDIGCGVGRMTKSLVPFFSEVVGIDIAPEAIDLARANCPKAEFMEYDGSSIPFPDGYFDGVLSWTTLQHVPDNEVYRLCQDISRATSEKSILILYENVSTWFSNKSHIWFRSISDYQNLFSKFNLETFDVIQDLEEEGEKHSLMLFRRGN